MENNQSNLPPEVQLPTLEEPKAKELSQEDLAKLVSALKNAQATNFKHRFQRLAGSAKPRVSKFWFNGNLITKAEHDKLTWEEIHTSNNVIRK